MVKVSDKTVYNFVERCRKLYDLPKKACSVPRIYERLGERDYGEYAQVDFDEKWMRRPCGSMHKVRFMTMILCRSRHKFCYLQSLPFTAESAVVAHAAAFAYFGGQPPGRLFTIKTPYSFTMRTWVIPFLQTRSNRMCPRWTLSLYFVVRPIPKARVWLRTASNI